MKGYSFRRQRPVDEYIADFMCRELSLVIEVDGITHDNEQVESSDNLRDKRLQELGFTILRFTSNDVLNHIAGVRNVIELWIDEFEKKSV